MLPLGLPRWQLPDVHLLGQRLRRQQQEILALLVAIDPQSFTSQVGTLLLRTRRIILRQFACGGRRAMRRRFVGHRRQRCVL
jgi:hypothetical protein